MGHLKFMLNLENKSPMQRPQDFTFCHECLKGGGGGIFYKRKQLFVLHKDRKIPETTSVGLKEKKNLVPFLFSVSSLLQFLHSIVFPQCAGI